MRIVSFRRFQGITARQAVEHVLELAREIDGDRLRLGQIKLFVDGSIQGFSARLRWPGYYNGAPNGLWYTPPEPIRELYRLALEARRAGAQPHQRRRGDRDGARLPRRRRCWTQPARDHRFTLQHCQLADAAQFRRMKALGMCVNLFPNHHFYWGDQHYATTVGPERAMRMNACATALATGVPMAIHSDAPVTPLGPLFTAWCAVNRRTASGPDAGRARNASASPTRCAPSRSARPTR